MANKEKRSVWFLRAPGHPLAIVAAENFEQASVKAAQYWDVPWAKVAWQIETERKIEQRTNVCAECGSVFNNSREALCERCRTRRQRQREEMQKAAGAYRRREFYRKERGR